MTSHRILRAASRRCLPAVLAGALAVLATGCVQYPTSEQRVADIRPTLSFRAAANDPTRLDARIEIDGLDAGRVGDYLEGAGALRVLPGNHVVRVIAAGRALLEEKVYIGDGVNRTVVLP